MGPKSVVFFGSKIVLTPLQTICLSSCSTLIFICCATFLPLLFPFPFCICLSFTFHYPLPFCFLPFLSHFPLSFPQFFVPTKNWQGGGVVFPIYSYLYLTNLKREAVVDLPEEGHCHEMYYFWNIKLLAPSELGSR
jgi:hypothetical protein